jgi:hypothetical protein
MSDNEDTSAEAVDHGIGPVPYIVAVMSIIPVLGMLLGLVAVIWGLATYRRGGKVVAILGAAGIGGQALIYAGVIHLIVH